jgi:hypothetical protein
MLLPETNSIELAETNDELVLDASDRPAPTLDDMLALLPGWARDLESPVRDALLLAWRAMANHLWARIGQLLAAGASPRAAEGIWLEAWGQELRRARFEGETDAQYRARLLSPPDVVSPNAVVAAVHEVTLAAGAPDAYLFEEPGEGSTSIAFAAADDDGPWECYVQPSASRISARDDARPGAVWGMYAGPEPPNRAMFTVVLPTVPHDNTDGFSQPLDSNDLGFVEDVSAPSLYVFDYRGDMLLERVAAEVERVRGGGVLWKAWHDPALAYLV